MVFNIEDVQVDTYRPSGSGGSTAWLAHGHNEIRITHKPTGFVEILRGEMPSVSLTMLKKQALENLKKKVEYVFTKKK
jgi:protein subunit release factor A